MREYLIANDQTIIYMKDFKSGGFRGGNDRSGNRGGFGGGFRDKSSYGDRGGDRGGRPSFNKKPWDKGGDKQMFDATCGNCGKACQVPFRPVDGRPVFCTDCFSRGNTDGSRNDAPRGDFKRDFKPSFNQGSSGGETYRAPKPANDPRMNDVIKQLESMNSKLDKLIGAMSAGNSKIKTETVADVIAAATTPAKKSIKAGKVVKTPAKKAAKKK